MTTSLKNDLIFYKEDGKIKSGGYTVDSILLQKGKPPMTTFNTYEQTGGDNISSNFKELAVPAGLSYISKEKPSSDLFSGGKNVSSLSTDHNMLSDEIYDKLFGLVEYDKKQKRQTKKHRRDTNFEQKEIPTIKKSKKTRKNV